LGEIAWHVLGFAAVKYAVAEIFHSIQGQGYWSGTPAVFVRLQGCDVGCPWCNEKQTWEFSEPNMTLEEIVRQVDATGCQHVILTGGEPLAQDVMPLVRALTNDKRRVQIETSGTELLPPPSLSYWLTVSPKFGMKRPIIADCGMSEIKLMVGRQSDVDQARDYIRRAPGIPVFLHPISGSKKATEICVREAMANNWRVSVQLHTLLGLR